MGLEIERKFLLPEYPAQLIQEGTLSVANVEIIEQTYLAIDDGEELRVRKIRNPETGEVHYTHTYKNGKGISREEIEYNISQGLYEQLIQAFDLVPLVKKRITGVWQGINIEIDVYSQLELSVVEVEFDSYDAAISFSPPGWFGKDVSDVKEYRNKVVWLELQKKKTSG
ncbi:CYTH domain-containing protein [Paenibacillus sp. S150]|uniref:CYTH domain-containing protein n=1 Tax=Paenibacillus sp. S150 TaxID=2749826 RepID=UPI001C57A0B5|nr:CYTH domain-containing protein [Paenibacillus sp. S150]MBW4082404.1 CYTH domain-containing protein [Paenibacillus sp. S150]